MTFTSDFPTAPLSTVAAFINGDRSTNYPKGEDYVDEGVPFISAADLENGRVDYSRCRQISNLAYERLRSGKIQNRDILFCLRGSLGKMAYVREHESGAIASSLVIVRPKGHVDPRYLFYTLSSQGMQQIAGGLNNGAAQPNLSVAELQRVEIPLPTASTQRRIAGILSAYDELIENSQRRIRILESMARALYREWFVHFRFPGHERHRRVASPLGEIPEGWRVARFTETVDVLSGGTPKTTVTEYWTGTIPFFTPRDAPDCFYVQDTEKHITELGLSKCASELYPPDTVFITARGTVGKIAISSVPMAMNQSCYALRGKSGIPQRYLFLLALEQVGYLKTNTGGATFDTIVVDTFHRMQIITPPLDTIVKFEASVSPMFDQINALQRQISNLRRTRDLLLPRLLSGQITLETEAA